MDSQVFINNSSFPTHVVSKFIPPRCPRPQVLKLWLLFTRDRSNAESRIPDGGKKACRLYGRISWRIISRVVQTPKQEVTCHSHTWDSCVFDGHAEDCDDDDPG